jgi:hypothetical protein
VTALQAAPLAPAALPPAISMAQLMAHQMAASQTTVPVTVKTFARAESDMNLGRTVKQGGFGKFRTPTPIDQQDVVRMNRKTRYSPRASSSKSATPAAWTA